MGFVRCELPHPVFIVLPVRCLEKTTEDYPGTPFPQNAAEVEADFLENSERGVLVLVDEKQPDNPRISFCTPRYELVCGLTQQRDAWFAIRMGPLSLRTHNQIARGAVRVAPETWGMVDDLPELNRQGYGDSAGTGIEAILAAWKQARQPLRSAPAKSTVPASGADSAQRTFLSNVDTLIELACEVELERAARQERVLIKSAEQLSRSAYRFELNTQSGFRVGAYLQAGNGETSSEIDGIIAETTGNSLVLRFYQPVEPKTVQSLKWLAPKVSTKQYTIQHAAVQALRNGESLNPRLLSLILENRFESYPTPTITSGAGKPNPAQKTMIERALIVPDLLLALGPPGTGKTDSIREIVARQSALGKKVLVTSKNNKAVDNVLDGLKNVHALRIGREEVVAPEVRSLLIDNRASAMQAKILENIRPVQENFESLSVLWPQIQQTFAHLSQLTTDWQLAQDGLEQKQTELADWQAACFTRMERTIERQEKHSSQLRARLEQATRQAESLRRPLAFLQRLSQLPLLGGMFARLVERLSQVKQETAREHHEAVQELRKSRESIHRLWAAYRQFISTGEQATRFKQEIEQAQKALETAQAQIAAGLDELNRLSDSLPDQPAQPEIISPSTLAALFLAWQDWYESQMRRRELLAKWREMIQTRQQALYPTLIRSADVVGATCIGIATDARFEDLEFDLVIADEAGQIQVMDLLVPLVRARRAVLVGDHLQLPPLVEPEIVQKIRENEPENQELGQWLEKSLFERLIERAETPASNKVMLDTQYRMPRQIADFISGQFYGGNYHTGHQNIHADAFFTGSPLVFVDTMKEIRHFEQRAEDGQGYFNPTEARLISDLLLAYQGKGVEAGVIVPYKKQAEAIRRELRKRQSGLSEDDLLGRVATVDSFQGKEQDVIIFGFTRSNAEGRIGFLAELRRLNVSLTRARRQLLLVGDSVTLSGTPDQDFACLIKALLESVKKTPKGYLYASELPRHIQP
ncbi:MAG: hypothetical protein CVU44_01630 [Chloroflexi bacterium HGW-Chloroflexi-6]|nr:MAG: hypothetical protein CVU44_01630 [Chloroflexi bacterium HGW-Chloroflexi-6]